MELKMYIEILAKSIISRIRWEEATRHIPRSLGRGDPSFPVIDGKELENAIV